MFIDSEDKGKMLAEGKQGKKEKISAINTSVKALPEEKHSFPITKVQFQSLQEILPGVPCGFKFFFFSYLPNHIYTVEKSF